ncbi:MAG: polymer-forming cytoskeletal protein [Spirochaetales bacterium]|nr:polymer-forming cytoskeletal protein [Spirochaetales bacterium]
MARDNEKGYERTRTTLGSETVFDGIMRFTESLKIDGNFKGEIESTGFLYIEKGARVSADIKVKSLVIGGIVHGNIIATDSLEMLDSGEVFGNVKTSRLRIADGVIFEGKCEMIKDPDSLDVFAGDVDKLKRTIQKV